MYGLVKRQEASWGNVIFCGHFVTHLFISSFAGFPPTNGPDPLPCVALHNPKPPAEWGLGAAEPRAQLASSGCFWPPAEAVFGKTSMSLEESSPTSGNGVGRAGRLLPPSLAVFPWAVPTPPPTIISPVPVGLRSQIAFRGCVRWALESQGPAAALGKWPGAPSHPRPHLRGALCHHPTADVGEGLGKPGVHLPL